MLHYLIDYGCFLIGAVLYMLSKVKEYKDMAKANPDPKVIYSTKNYLNGEWINIVRLLIGGIALVIFLPLLVGGATVDIKNTEGAVIASMAIKSVLAPMYFLIGYSGNSAMFALFGKYKKTLLNRVGVDDNP